MTNDQRVRCYPRPNHELRTAQQIHGDTETNRWQICGISHGITPTTAVFLQNACGAMCVELHRRTQHGEFNRMCPLQDSSNQTYGQIRTILATWTKSTAPACNKSFVGPTVEATPGIIVQPKCPEVRKVGRATKRGTRPIGANPHERVRYGADNSGRCHWLRLAMHGDACGPVAAKADQNVGMRHFAHANADVSKQYRNMYRCSICIVDAAQSVLDTPCPIPPAPGQNSRPHA